MGKCNHYGKVGHKAAHCWEHEANKDKRPKNWKKKEDKEVGASYVEVLLGLHWNMCNQIKMVRFCSKLICGKWCSKSLTRYQYPAIHLMITKTLWAILIWKKPKKMVWMARRVQVGLNAVNTKLRSWQYLPEWLCCKMLIFGLVTCSLYK